MRAIPMLPLLLALSLVPSADHPQADRHDNGRMVRAYDLATLTEAEAERLHNAGQSTLFLVQLDSPPLPGDNWTMYYCRGTGADRVRRTLLTLSARPVPARAIVRATLQMIRQEPSQDGPGFIEYRLMAGD